MKIAVVGAGFTGITTAYRLSKEKLDVTLFEKADSPGGLALGYKNKNWKWSLEEYYHHWFTNDNFILNLANEIGTNVVIKRPKSSMFIEDDICQLDSPISALTFKKLTPTQRIRMSAIVAFLRYDPFWRPLEKIRAVDFLPKTMGKTPYEKIWETQLRNKFGSYADEISLAWFWARIKKRTTNLAYPEKGFLNFADKLIRKIKKQNGTVLFKTEIQEIKEEKEKILIKYNSKKELFDKVIFTLPTFALTKITPTLPEKYKKELGKLKGLGAINIILRLKKQFLRDNTYWLSICDKKSPLMAIVEHTNFMDSKNYNNEHLLYLGNYISPDHKFFGMNKYELMDIYHPLLLKINKDYKKEIIDFDLFKSSFAQPIIPTNYSKIIPSFRTPFKNLFLANMQQVYPWDRGTNYAVELGEKIVKIVKNEL